MKSAGKARSNGLYRHIRTSKEIIRNLLNDSNKTSNSPGCLIATGAVSYLSLIRIERLFNNFFARNKGSLFWRSDKDPLKKASNC